MKRVYLAVPPVETEYPYAAIREGVRRLGWQVMPMVGDIADADLLITWSPWNGSRRQALQRSFVAAGKPVIVVENGWLSPLGGRTFYQVALDGWNGTGAFPAGGPERWERWRVMPWAWKQDGSYALVIGQRGGPDDPRTAARDWHKTLHLPLPVLRRDRDCPEPLHVQLKNAAECHVWTSNAASWAVLLGVPVVQHGPNLMVSALASRPGEPLVRPERVPEMERLAWSQFTAGELHSGEPFARLAAHYTATMVAGASVS